MKSVWDGSLSFGLVNIPVRLYPAIESQALGFRLLHSKCHTPLKYKRWCPKCKVEVTWDEVVKVGEVGRVKGKGRKKEKTLIDILKASLKQA